jgi:hypothetical protein
MASIEDLKRRIDLHDLADRLGLRRGKGSNANYFSPGRDEASPSLSIKDGRWKDWGGDGAGGSCIDLVMYVRGLEEIGEAVKVLHEMYGLPMDPPPGSTAPRAERSLAEHIADRCLADPAPGVRYLVEERGISPAVAERAVKKGAVGFNDYRSRKTPEGEVGHGGPAVAFIVRTLNPGHVMAVDLRYVEPALNGGVKTQSQGDKAGYGWTSDIRRLHAAHTVVVVESAINALSVECCELPGVAAFALRGTKNVDIDWAWARGKQVVICCDNDAPIDAGPMAGVRPGLSAAWALHERLTALDISALLVDQSEWAVNDVNDFLRASGADALRSALGRLEAWLIPGYPGVALPGKRRLFLPAHHWSVYPDFRVKPDFTSMYAEKVIKGPDGDSVVPYYKDIAGFRVASISRVTIASATATMTGDEDSQPRTLFAVSVQTARHGAALQRRVLEDEKLHNIDAWKRFGPVWNQAQFLRMVNILENAAHIGARDAANFVGLCWKDRRLVVNEGPDCYFTSPEQQCPYHNLTFPSGSRQAARSVIEAYQTTFGRSAALIPLIWGLGGHLKVLLGFWPHLQVQADKGAGKSTLIKRLERSIAFTMFSGQSLQTEYRLLTSISHTSHPVGWEELSARRQEVIDKAVALLQENYQYTVNRRGADMTEFLLAAPVMLAGEDVPVRSLIGKLVRTELKVKGPLLPDDLPRFPVRQWLEFLTDFSPAQVRTIYAQLREHCLKHSRSSGQDDGATRMAGNYAAVLTAWRLLAEFADVDPNMGGVGADILAQMNGHIAETSADREPWVWIMETLLAEVTTGQFQAPIRWDEVEGEAVLMVRTSDVMHHLARTPALREHWNSLPVKSDRVFRKQACQAGVVLGNTHERTVHNRRVSHLTAFSLPRLAGYGLHAVVPDSDARV